MRIFLLLLTPLLMGAACSRIFNEDYGHCSCFVEIETDGACEFDKLNVNSEWLNNVEGTETEASVTAP